MRISEYITNINRRYKTGISLEPVFHGRKLGKVQINDEQYFSNVPLTSWNFYIGGYQPAEKWLKDRSRRTTGKVIREIDGFLKLKMKKIL